MRFKSLLGPASENAPRGTRIRPYILSTLTVGTIVATVAYLGFAQSPPGQIPAHQPHSIILPEANRLPDANQQMEMREQRSKEVNFDAANAERLKEMTEATEMMETMAIALKAEIDNSNSTQLSPNALRKAEMIEKLARVVKERMQLTVGPK
jgi:hypothetical protein